GPPWGFTPYLGQNHRKYTYCATSALRKCPRITSVAPATQLAAPAAEEATGAARRIEKLDPLACDENRLPHDNLRLTGDPNLLTQHRDHTGVLPPNGHQPHLTRANRHANLNIPDGDVVAEVLPTLRQTGVNRELAFMIAQATKAIGQRSPHPAAGGDVHAVSGIAMHIRQVQKQPAVEELQGLIRIAELRGHDGLHHRREGGIPRGQLVVVVIVRPLNLLGESLPLQEQGQHHVRLLQDLIAVDRQRVIVQQQGPLRLTVRIVQIPDLAVEEEVILWINPQLLIEGDIHLLGGQLPAVQLGIVELVLGSQV